MRKILLSSVALSAAAWLGLPATASAQPVPHTQAMPQSDLIEKYWTPERMRAAKPIDLRPAYLPKPSQQMPAHVGTPTYHPGSAPTVKQDLRQDPGAKNAELEPDIAPPNVGNSGAYFTTTRVFPTVASKTYPNSTTGILYFTDPVTGGNYICSAAAISNRLVVTAGHCTAHADPNNPYFYTNWLFVPSNANGVAPYGKWTVGLATTTSNWYYSNGSVPNVQDVGVLVTNDHKLRGGVTRTLASYTGYLGWWTQWGRSYPNNVMQLGYPCNLDSCTLMEANTAQGAGIWNNTVEIGSAMQGGSSGGPWIQDYGVAPAGAPPYTAGNWVLGVTSWGFNDPSQMMQGASIFENAGYSGNGFGDLWNLACNAAPGNC